MDAAGIHGTGWLTEDAREILSYGCPLATCLFLRALKVVFVRPSRQNRTIWASMFGSLGLVYFTQVQGIVKQQLPLDGLRLKDVRVMLTLQFRFI